MAGIPFTSLLLLGRFITITVGSLAEHELTDQALKHDGGLRQGNFVARIQRLVVSAGINAD